MQTRQNSSRRTPIHFIPDGNYQRKSYKVEPKFVVLLATWVGNKLERWFPFRKKTVQDISSCRSRHHHLPSPNQHDSK
jgi:hypothetical protein